MDLSGILLAGGKSSRFTSNKIKIMSGGTPLLIEQIAKLAFFTDEVVIATSDMNVAYINNILAGMGDHVRMLDLTENRRMPEIRIAVDSSIPGAGTGDIGPVAGIYSGLKKMKCSFGLVLASDMPFVSFKLLKLLTGRAAWQSVLPDAVIIRIKAGVEALCGIYSKKCIKIIERNILKGVYKISDILNDLDVSWIGPEELREKGIDIYNFFNINLPGDVEEFKRLQDMGVRENGTDNLNSGTGKKWKDNFFRGTDKRADPERI